MERVSTIPAKAVEKIIRAVVARGISASSFCHAVSFNLSLLDDPDSRIPFSEIVSFYEQGAILTGDDAFGLHVGESVDPRAFGVIGYVVINSSTMGSAIDRAVRYHSIWTDGAFLKLETDNEIASISYKYVDDSIVERRQDAEMTLATIFSLS